ncbi:hypothetical protein [Lentilactobacillus buchneri]|uniref:hypothetical protein n=1 Tax=Lentilactobacillus buchneri TaxID=1581 RepID=UPI0021A5C4DE|nr:hypothetical protein [Lentilactobacillus buchneri]
MSEYHDSQLTAFGADLAQRASNGDTKFTITKATSTADDLSQTDLSQLITLPHEKQTGEIDRILPDPNGGTKVKGTKVSFDNLNLTENYPIQAMGLYAKEDVDGAKEQVYAVTTAADPETMPKSDSAIMFTFAVSIYVVVGNAKQVTINVNPDSFATKEYVADAIANVKVDTSDLAKLNQDNYYTGDNQFKHDPVNKNGDAYGLAKDIDTKVTDNGDGSIVVNGKTFVPADDSQVVHTSGDEEVGGTKTFDTAPVDKTTGHPYITKDGVPAVPSTLADTTKMANFTGGLQKGGIDVATAADLKSVENSAWRVKQGSSDLMTSYTCLYRINSDKRRIEFVLWGLLPAGDPTGKTIVDFSEISSTFKSIDGNATQGLNSDYAMKRIIQVNGSKISISDSGTSGNPTRLFIAHHSLINPSGDYSGDNEPCYLYY